MNRFLSHKGNWRDNKVNRAWKVRCCMCRAEKVVPCPRSGTNHPEKYVLNEFERCGWYIASHSSSDCCPHHTPQVRERRSLPAARQVLESLAPVEIEAAPVPEPEPVPAPEPEPSFGPAYFAMQGIQVNYTSYGSIEPFLRKLEADIFTLAAMIEGLQSQPAPLAPQVIKTAPRPPPTGDDEDTRARNRQMVRELQAQLALKRRAS